MPPRILRVISFTDDQLRDVLECAAPLPPESRDVYPQTLAAELKGTDLGDGTVHRAAIKAQRDVVRMLRMTAAS